ncbi:hypothetical protein CR513_43147, partial [Mucuna pruriens]
MFGDCHKKNLRLIRNIILSERAGTDLSPLSETESVQLCCVRLRLVETMSDPSLSRPYRTSLCRESSFDPLYDLDLEIEITLRRLRKARNIVVSNSNSSNSVSSFDNSNPVTNTSDSVQYSSTNNFELATPDVVYQPWCIRYPQLEPAQTYELKSGLIQSLPKFHGLVGEDPHKHLKEFHVAVRDTGGLHQNEGISIFLGWSCKGLAVSAAGSLQHLGRHEAHVFGEIISGIQNCDHQEGDLWDKETF